MPTDDYSCLAQIFVILPVILSSQTPGWLSIADSLKNLLKQRPRHHHFGHLEHHLPRMPDYLGSDLDELLTQRCQRPLAVNGLHRLYAIKGLFVCHQLLGKSGMQ